MPEEESMTQPVRIGIVGDYNQDSRSHIATNEALTHAAESLSIALEYDWLPTQTLAAERVDRTLRKFNGLWAAPGSPYSSTDGALNSIRFAREQGWPFIGTWGGFQHALLEYARNVLGIRDAEHEETAPNASTLIISKLACSLDNKTQKLKIFAGSLVHQAYGRGEVTEQFFCNYGLNPKFRDTTEKGRLIVAGVDLYGEVRVVELSDHPFYVGTLYQPQLSSTLDSPHPLIVAYLRAALDFKTSDI